MKKRFFSGLLLAIVPCMAWLNATRVEAEVSNNGSIVANSYNTTEGDYNLFVTIYTPSRKPTIKEMKALGYNVKELGTPNPYVVAYGPIISHQEISDYTQVTTNPYWLYANWPYHKITHFDEESDTYMLASWDTDDTFFYTMDYSSFNVQDELPSRNRIDIDSDNAEPLYAYVLWVIYEDAYNKQHNIEPVPWGIKLSKSQITDACGTLYNQGGGASIFPYDAIPFYGSFTSLKDSQAQ